MLDEKTAKALCPFISFCFLLLMRTAVKTYIRVYKNQGRVMVMATRRFPSHRMHTAEGTI